jgi:hypothetical protein
MPFYCGCLLCCSCVTPSATPSLQARAAHSIIFFFVTRVSRVCRDLVHVSLGQGSARAFRGDRRARSGFDKQTTHSRCSKDFFLVSEALDSCGQIDCRFDRRVALGNVRLKFKTNIRRSGWMWKQSEASPAAALTSPSASAARPQSPSTCPHE